MNVFRLFALVCSCVVWLSLGGCATAREGNLTIKEIPYPLEVVNEPESWTVKDGTLEISARGKTNLFNNPDGLFNVQNAPMVVFQPKGDFTLSAKVSGKLKSVYDVAALVVYEDKDTWAKFCYENSVEKIPTMVSVVTRTYSDDCNSMAAGDHAYMCIVKKGNEFSFFYSQDKTKWQMIRNFRLDTTKRLRAGFAAHGSRGDGFTGTFSEIQYRDQAVEDMRTL